MMSPQQSSSKRPSKNGAVFQLQRVPTTTKGDDMSRSRRKHEETLARRFQLTDAALEELLDEKGFDEAMAEARWRMIRLFAKSRSAPKKRSTPGYIWGLDEHLSSVEKFIYKNMSDRARNKIYSVNDLPEEDSRLETKRGLERKVRLVLFELFMRQLVAMRKVGHIWYQDGLWSMPPSVLDEYWLRFKDSEDHYRNEKHYHGRNNSARRQQKRLRRPPAVSVSMA